MLKFHASKAGGMGSILGWGTKTPPHALWHGQTKQNNPIIDIFNDSLPVNLGIRWDCHYCNIGGPDPCAKIRKRNKQYRDRKGKGKPVVTCDDMITYVENLSETISKLFEPIGESGILMATGKILY